MANNFMTENKELFIVQKEIVMLLAILVRRGALQSTLIKELGSVGFTPKRIAELLDTTPNTVRVALSLSKKKKGKKLYG